MTQITLNLAGPVTVTGPDMQDLTPASVKSRGLLAILGTSQHLRASRAKLQDKLWSDRGHDQGANSLRQALTEIRRSFGDYRDVVLSGSGWAALDPQKVKVTLTPATDHANPKIVEFAEDIDIRDPEFEDWLREQRQYFSAQWQGKLALTQPPVSPSHLALIVTGTTPRGSETAAMSDMILRDGAERAAAFMPAHVFDDPGILDSYPHALELSCHAVGSNELASLQFNVIRAGTQQQIWNRTVTAPVGELIKQFDEISGALTLAILNTGWGPPTDDPTDMTLSLRDVFSFTEDRLRKAELLLAKDEGQQDDAIRLALRAYIRNTMLLERFADDPHEMLAEATEFATRAIEQAPQNAVALAVASIIASRNRNVDLALDLARQAERADPNNPLSRDSLSSALTEAGEDDLAFQEAIRARAGPMTALSPATWLMRCAATAIRAHHLEQALRFARMAHGYAPNYRPALRFMAALEFRVGNEEAAADALQKLHMLEPDFSLKLMASDAYPVATLRTSGLLEVTKSGLF